MPAARTAARTAELELREYVLDGEPPHYGGMLNVDLDTGIAHCCACDWKGVPTVVDGVMLTTCPVCEDRAQAAPQGPRSPRRKAKGRKAQRAARRRNRR